MNNDAIANEPSPPDADPAFQPVVFTNNDINALAKAIKAAGRIVAQQSTFDRETADLGLVESLYDIRYPEDSPRYGPVLASAEIRLESGAKMDVWFRRDAVGDAWYTVAVGSYLAVKGANMTIPKAFYDFLEIELVSVQFIDREMHKKLQVGNLPESNAFYYRPRRGNLTIRYVFYSDPKLSSLAEGYPRSFYDMEITNDALKGKKNASTELPPIHCQGNEPCPRTGFWKATASDKSQFNLAGIQATPPYYIRQGEQMPDLAGEGNAAFITWHWLKDK